MSRQQAPARRETAEARPPAAARLARSHLGERLAGFVYGTIVALSVIVAGARAYPNAPGHVALLVAVTSAIFWLAHVYAHSLGHSVAHGEHLSLEEVRRIARHEGSIIEAAVPPIAALLLGAVGLVSDSVSVWLALGLGLAVLGAQGLIFARVERLGPLAAVAVVAANLALGLVLVALKLLLSH